MAPQPNDAATSQGDLQAWLETNSPADCSNQGLQALLQNAWRDGVNNQRMKSTWRISDVCWSAHQRHARALSTLIVCDEIDGYERTDEGTGEPVVAARRDLWR
ncbi:hypothetical protein LOK82_09780 [Xylella fastidiosa subsp. multiplex]|uniref:Uncharacterized protein n=1 Tax=Xylella fastidiosa subsp. multiplex TaxID=644357 RepID=A0AAW6HWB2_XYLFS|nr:hypothetical protein [Xylella fastidiosa subsp. multiplex]